MKCWRLIQEQMPRVGSELRDLVSHMRTGTLPKPGSIEKQTCRFASCLDWLMSVGAIRNG